jgi:hypothetical protein
MSEDPKYPDQLNQNFFTGILGFTRGNEECLLVTFGLFILFMFFAWLAIFLRNRKF